MKKYSYADKIFDEITAELLENKKEFEFIREINPRLLFIEVTKEDNASGMILPAFKNLPYEIKVNNIKERMISNKDVVFYVDHYFISECRTDKEIESLIYSCLNGIDLSVNKDGVFKIDTDGRPKIKLKKPDMEFKGYSEIIKKYGDDSPEKKMFNNLMNYNSNFFEENEE